MSSNSTLIQGSKKTPCSFPLIIIKWVEIASLAEGPVQDQNLQETEERASIKGKSKSMRFLAFRLHIEKFLNQRGNSVQNLNRVNAETKKTKRLGLASLKRDLKTKILDTTPTSIAPTTVTLEKPETKSLLDRKRTIACNKLQAWTLLCFFSLAMPSWSLLCQVKE